MNSTIKLLLCILLFADSTALAEYHLVNLEEMYMTGARLNPTSRDPLAPQYTGEWESREALHFRFNILGALYWDNEVHMETTTVPKTVGWHWMAGIRVVPALDLFYEHHSRHEMDGTSPSATLYDKGENQATFPVEDSYGIRINIFEGTKGGSLWK